MNQCFPNFESEVFSEFLWHQSIPFPEALSCYTLVWIFANGLTTSVQHDGDYTVSNMTIFAKKTLAVIDYPVIEIVCYELFWALVFETINF